MVSNLELETRLAQLTETTENYLKRIYILTIQHGHARISDIAKFMNRSLSSVTEAVQRMASDGLLHHEKYGKITMTELGQAVAETINKTYSLMNRLLQTLGVPEDIARLDACSMEHDISEDTMSAISKFLEFTRKNPEANKMMETFNS
ncbi:MAG: metal-dependent transcriptional regulator [Candidatus Kariarchaeaceae archaeon]|jgi:Mn-dependent DtxR family transcriptional regulator